MENESRTFSRRTFLGGAATSSLVAVAVHVSPSFLRPVSQDTAAGARLDAAVLPQQVAPIEPASPVLTLSVERDTDLFLADFTFYGFTVDKTSNPTMLVATAEQTSDNWIGVVVQLPPQAIGEADYAYDSTETIPFDPTPVLSQVAGPSRLAFTFGTGDTIPLPTMTPADLLDWSAWTLNVTPTALTGSDEQSPIEPSFIQTSIEAPLSLYLSPVVDGNPTFYYRFTTQFENRTEPFVSPRQVTECWTTSLNSIQTTDFFLEDANLSLPIGPVSTPVVPSVAVVWADDLTESANATPQQYIAYFPYEAPPK